MPSDQSLCVTDLKVDMTLDVTGLRCPMPLLKARQQLRAMPAHALLLVRADDPGARRDIPAWLGQADHELVHFADQDGVYEFFIRVGG
ncbi:sulfurtransferase TusA family protein [Alcanivorax sp. 1008]|uniref:sulfurtransferase TusA family protein n=1 Tax=Alcanivorax sp. 1008 TaxID=2816853 RepID=UPI001D719EFF|nr:sulfurtransferase TusA family protein [Alcanivorax sp. 1008]MCC1496461.1 sulfurtransferase TusA family protein [Alcanivorax sp. 1008]